ncbi:AAA family ATPase [Flavobacterium sp.]|uniref:AAA family ATPase n=1 Tax=Flavobacterium sp. TaxID=239 RepID=UPI0026260BB8|nr:AAA family ATPase [Flavobacterium sp.]
MERILYTYDRSQFYQYRDILSVEGKKIISISKFMQNQNEDIYDIDTDESIVDVSAAITYTDVLYFEHVFHKLPENTIFIVDDKHLEKLSYEMRNCFDKEFNVNKLLPEAIEIKKSDTIVKKKRKLIIDLKNEEIESFINNFNSKLYGHEKFKEDFANKLNEFMIFNKLGEHKILSLFLMGDSGVGKTEVARVIHKCLSSKNKLAKINFGNYSSQDALNSLIGSPRGYIGSDGGELFNRVEDSDIGLILIDEFEKSNSAVFNYFLDVLENGKLVNSLAEEIDVNGFIIVFTSNISKDDFPRRISPELRSRFNYKGIFNELKKEDKLKFAHFRINDIISKYEKAYNLKLSTNLHNDLIGLINVNSFKNMRDLNAEINKKFVKSITQ